MFITYIFIGLDSGHNEALLYISILTIFDIFVVIGIRVLGNKW